MRTYEGGLQLIRILPYKNETDEFLENLKIFEQKIKTEKIKFNKIYPFDTDETVYIKFDNFFLQTIKLSSNILKNNFRPQLALYMILFKQYDIFNKMANNHKLKTQLYPPGNMWLYKNNLGPINLRIRKAILDGL